MSFILYSFRQFRNWEQKDVAKGLAISVNEYKNLESGADSIDAETALKLSQLYQVPPQFFLANDSSAHLSVIYSHCHFENSNGYVNHLYQNDRLPDVKDEEIQLLKKEIKRLQKQNDELLKHLMNINDETK